MSNLSKLEKELCKEYGNVIMTAASVAEVEHKIIHTGPKLDYALGGGIPEGSRVIISGPPKFGKTTLVLQIAANAVKMGKKVFYYDVEGRFKKLNVYGVKGFDPEKVLVIRSTKEKILTAQDFLKIAKLLIKSPENEGSLHIIDSLSQLCPDEVATSEEVSGTRRSVAPKLIKDFFLQMAGVIPVMNVTLIAIQHMIANTSGYGAHSMEDGGSNVQYQADIKIRGIQTPTKILENEKQVGQKVIWDVITSALGPPAGKIESYIKFGYGVDDVCEIIELCSDFGIITKGGAWYDLNPAGIPQKLQGMEKTSKYLYDNEADLKILKDKFSQITNQAT